MGGRFVQGLCGFTVWPLKSNYFACIVDAQQFSCLLPPALPPCVQVSKCKYLCSTVFTVDSAFQLVVAAHRVVMDTLRAWLMLLVASPSFQAPSPSPSIVGELKGAISRYFGIFLKAKSVKIPIN